MKLQRWLFLGMAFVALFLGAGWLGTLWLAPAALAQAEVQLSRTLQTPVHLGRLQWLLPWQVVVGPVTIAGREKPDLLQADRAVVGFDLARFVLGQGLDARLSLDRPVFRLRRDSDGRFNLPGWQEEVRQNSRTVGRLLSQLVVRDGTFYYDDRVFGGRALAVQGLTAEAHFDDRGAQLELTAPLGQGQVQATGHSDLRTLDTVITARLVAIPAPLAASIFNLGDLAVRRGVLEGAVQLQLHDGHFSGSGPLRLVGGELVLHPLRPALRSLDVSAQLAWPQVVLSRLTGELAGSQVRGRGVFDLPEDLRLDLQLAGPLERSVPAFTVPSVPVRGEAKIALTATIPLAHAADLTARAQVLATTPVRVDRLQLAHFESTVELSGLRLRGPFRFDLAHGSVQGQTDLSFVPGTEAFVTVHATGHALAIDELVARYDGRLPLVERAGAIDFEATVQGAANRLGVTADFKQSGGLLLGKTFESTGTAILDNSNLTIGPTRLRLGDGAEVVATGGAALAGLRPFDLNLDLRAMPLALVSARLGGTARGQLALAGSLNTLAALAGNGSLQAAEPRLDGHRLPALATRFQLSDERLQLKVLRLGGIAATGTLALNLAEPAAPLLRQADLRLAVDRFDLAAVPVPVRLQGELSGSGTFRGNLQNPDLRLALEIRGAKLGRYRAPRLTGPLSWQGGAIRAQLRGEDQLWSGGATLLPQGMQLLSLKIASNRTRIDASRGFYDFRQGLTQLSAHVQDLELSQLLSAPIGPIRALAGRLDADIDLKRTARGLNGSLQVDLDAGRVNEFALGPTHLAARLSGDRLEMAPTLIAIEDGRYTLSGQIGLAAGVPLALDLGVEDGRLEQLVRLLGLQSLSALFAQQRGTVCCASRLGPLNTGGELLPLQQLLTVYQQASQVALARLNDTAERLIPDNLRSLEGDFALKAHLGGRLAAPEVGFDFSGTSWQWEQWRLDALQAQGNYRDGILNLDAAQIRYANRTARLSGRLSLAGEQAARLVVDRFPVEVLEPLLPQATAIAGNLSAEAQIAGNLRAPVVFAAVSLSNLTLNRRTIDPVRTNLTLVSGRIIAQTTAIGVASRGVQLAGSLPVPFLHPDNRQLDIDVTLPAENLPLLNLLSDQLVWQPARGDATITLRGTYDDVQIDGTAQISAAHVRIPRLQTTLAIDRFKARFDGREVLVEALAGNLGGAALAGQGAIALIPRDTLKTPLQLTIGGKINLPGLYRGAIEGELAVGRALLRPRIGGQLRVKEGELLLSLQDIQALSGASSNLRSAASRQGAGLASLPLSFDNLQLKVGPQFRINVTALSARLDGQLALDRSIRNLSIEGYLDVPQGALTIGTANFRLDGSRRNALYFDGDLDPAIDLRAEARVSEYRPTNALLLDSGELRNPSAPGDPASLGRIQTIDIVATVTGSASEPDIDLVSHPFRTETEVLALIGGGGGAGTLLTGLVPAVGSSLLNPVEQSLANALGLDELRIDLASQVATATPQNIALGVGIEAIKDLTPAVSVSVFKNLTDNIQPVLFGVRYRIDDQLVTRLSANENFDNVSFSIQFESRF